MPDDFYGLSLDEAERRYARSSMTPQDIVKYAGRLQCCLVFWPRTWPSYQELWSWCGYCGEATDDVGYLSVPPHTLWLCHACVVWAGLFRPEKITGAFVLMPNSRAEDYGDPHYTMCQTCGSWSDQAPPCPSCGTWSARWPTPPRDGWEEG